MLDPVSVTHNQQLHLMYVSPNCSRWPLREDGASGWWQTLPPSQLPSSALCSAMCPTQPPCRASRSVLALISLTGVPALGGC